MRKLQYLKLKFAWNTLKFTNSRHGLEITSVFLLKSKNLNSFPRRVKLCQHAKLPKLNKFQKKSSLFFQLPRGSSIASTLPLFSTYLYSYSVYSLFAPLLSWPASCNTHIYCLHIIRDLCIRKLLDTYFTTSKNKLLRLNSARITFILLAGTIN